MCGRVKQICHDKSKVLVRHLKKKCIKNRKWKQKQKITNKHKIFTTQIKLFKICYGNCANVNIKVLI